MKIFSKEIKDKLAYCYDGEQKKRRGTERNDIINLAGIVGI